VTDAIVTAPPPSRRRRRLTAAVLLAAVALLLIGCTPRPDLESELLADLNQRRGAQGLSPLPVNSGLEGAARDHAIHMMAHGFRHAVDLTGGSLAGSARFGENIARGWSSASIAEALWNSPGHRANILGDWTHVGIGVFEDGNGRLWVVYRFEG
jgi:uncharacterized protein YkwD